jgi:hypothetical protein
VPQVVRVGELGLGGGELPVVEDLRQSRPLERPYIY